MVSGLQRWLIHAKSTPHMNVLEPECLILLKGKLTGLLPSDNLLGPVSPSSPERMKHTLEVEEAFCLTPVWTAI